MKLEPESFRPQLFKPFQQQFGSLQKFLDRFSDPYSFQKEWPLIEFQHNPGFIPSCDWEETDEHYLISLDIPGMSRDQIHIEISGKTLTVSGAKQETKKEGSGVYRHMERTQGSSLRSFYLPDLEETGEGVEADYKDGVLRIVIPKSAKTKSHKIKIGEGKSGIWNRLIGKGEEKKEIKVA